MEKQKLSLSITKLSFEVSNSRTNYMAVKGTCMFVDRASDHTPSGGDKPVLFPRADIEKALPTFVGMGINCKQNFEGHDSQFKIGVVDSAVIQGDEVVITGGLWSLDFKELCDEVKASKESLGWSIEPLMYLEDKGSHYVASETEFLGVALMQSDKAAFAKTRMAAQKKQEKDEGQYMDEQKLTLLLAGLQDTITKAISDNIEGVKAEFSAQIGEVSKVVTEFQASLVAEKEALKLQAEQDALAAEEKAKLALEAQAALDAENAEKAKLALEAEAIQRKTLMFGAPMKRFEGETDAQKAIMENKDLDAGAQFRALIDLKLQQAK